MKAIAYLLLVILLAVSAYALIITAEDNSGEITLIDVSADGQSCIFSVYGKTIVVDKRDKQTVEGVTIYVQDVYPVNSEAQNADRCKFMYSGVAEQKDENPVKQTTIGETIINFMLGKRDEQEITTEQNAEIIVEQQKEPAEQNVVKVNGYDVTQNTEEETTKQAIQESTPELTFFQKLKRFLFG
jgi:hypothetical protein